MFRFRMIGHILRAAGLGWATLAFVVIFVLCVLVIGVSEPAVAGRGDILWFCFQAVTTIGFGDIVVTAPLARIATVLLSIVSLFYLAVLTGSVVSYCQELLRLRMNESIAAMQDKLEHLPELSADELEELSRRVRAIR